MRSRVFIVVSLLVAAAWIFPVPVQAAEVTLAWDQNSESDLAGYRMCYGDASGGPYEGTTADEGPSPVDIPLANLADVTNPEITLTGMPSCEHVYFAATAYDTSGNESDYSNEVHATLIAQPTGVQVAVGGADSAVITWSGLPSGDDGTLSGYNVHYDSDSGVPYQGTGAAEGDSPVSVGPGVFTLELTGLTGWSVIYVAVEAECSDSTVMLSAEVSDTFVAAECGNSIIEDGETCDPPATCPTSCDDSDPCTVDTLTGSAANCNAACNFTDITGCIDDDGCCLPECNSTTDNDCSATCGNNIIDDGETCDPPADCPTSCDDGDPCTVDELIGSAANCNAACTYNAISVCANGDGCCPDGCNIANDDDCDDSGGPTGACDCGAFSSGAAPGAGIFLLLLAVISIRRRR
jgi:hypothetical protein